MYCRKNAGGIIPPPAFLMSYSLPTPIYLSVQRNLPPTDDVLLSAIHFWQSQYVPACELHESTSNKYLHYAEQSPVPLPHTDEHNDSPDPDEAFSTILLLHRYSDAGNVRIVL